MVADYSPMMTMHEACRYLRISRTTMYRLIEAGEMKSVQYRPVGMKGGAKRMFKRSDLDAYIEAHYA